MSNYEKRKEDFREVYKKFLAELDAIREYVEHVFTMSEAMTSDNDIEEISKWVLANEPDTEYVGLK